MFKKKMSFRFHRWTAVFIFLSITSLGLQSQDIVCPVIADNSIASYHSETKENTGSSKSTKIKGRENQTIMKFDLSKIPANSSIKKAVLRVKLTTPTLAIRQIGYSTVPTDWIEGKGAKPEEPNKEFSCHSWPGGEGKYWGRKGSDILEVIHGNGGNVNGWVLAEQKRGRYEIVLPGRVVEAMIKDQKGGLILMDESGWWAGARSNIYIMSRESKTPPILIVTLGGQDKTAPGEPTIKQIPDDTDDGEMLLEITCSGGDGDKGMALGYDIKISEGAKIGAKNWKSATFLPRYLIKRPQKVGSKIKIWVKNLKPGVSYDIGIQAYDAAGNYSKIVSTGIIKASGPSKKPDLNIQPIKFSKGGPLKMNGLQVWAVDELIKINPIDGKILDGSKYIDKKHREGSITWNGEKKSIELFGAKAEIVSFRLALELSDTESLKSIALFPKDLKNEKDTISSSNITFRRDWYAKTKSGWYACAMPRLNGKNGGIISIPASDQKIDGQKNQSIYVSIVIPKNTNPGSYLGGIVISANDSRVTVPINLNVYNATIPDQISYIIELNSYGYRGDDDEAKKKFHGIHRMAHEFRLGYNSLGYSHSGNRTLPFIPAIKGEGKDAKVESWDKWDSWMGPLLDGSAFKGLPREGTPIPHYYLPFYESYPTKIYKEYAGGMFHNNKHVKSDGKWNRDEWRFYLCKNDVFVSDGFSSKWKAAAISVSLDYRKHFESKGWTKTEFQIFANNKLYGRNSAKKKTTSLWTLDEPSFGRDFRALQFLYDTFQKPFKGTKLNVVTRGDVSRPEWQGDRLDGACEVSVVSSSIYSSQDIIQKRVHEHGSKYWFYGGGKGIATDLSQLSGLYMKTWTLGCVGGLAYWTSQHGNDWDEDDVLALTLSSNHGYTGATPTDRIVAQRRAQQDIELLNLLKNKKGWSYRRVVQAVNSSIDLASKTVRKNADDPGTTSMASISADKLSVVRKAVLELLAK
ncbi:MAG: hypothetical protein COA79_24490 [Planctomycetota bacterium]|nr:MAG: hypothetical protein COA79_24490 [Planctomycetota bacterium]